MKKGHSDRAEAQMAVHFAALTKPVGELIEAVLHKHHRAVLEAVKELHERAAKAEAELDAAKAEIVEICAAGAESERQLHQAHTDRDALQRFKTFVHHFLDEAGVPVDPPGKHRDEGCRVGQRLESLVSERDGLRSRHYALAHAVWHALDDSCEDASTGETTITRDDYQKLCELVPEAFDAARSAP